VSGTEVVFQGFKSEHGGFMKVLVVDDNILTRIMLKDLLTNMRHQIIGEAESCDEAVKAFKDLRPDIVLLDLILLGKPGLEALQGIRAIDPAAKVVMVTAVQQEIMNRRLLDMGASAVLHKPFLYEELETVLQQQG